MIRAAAYITLGASFTGAMFSIVHETSTGFLCCSAVALMSWMVID